MMSSLGYLSDCMCAERAERARAARVSGVGRCPQAAPGADDPAPSSAPRPDTSDPLEVRGARPAQVSIAGMGAMAALHALAASSPGYAPVESPPGSATKSALTNAVDSLASNEAYSPGSNQAQADSIGSALYSVQPRWTDQNGLGLPVNGNSYGPWDSWAQLELRYRRIVANMKGAPVPRFNPTTPTERGELGPTTWADRVVAAPGNALDALRAAASSSFASTSLATLGKVLLGVGVGALAVGGGYAYLQGRGMRRS